MYNMTEEAVQELTTISEWLETNDLSAAYFVLQYKENYSKDIIDAAEQVVTISLLRK